MQSERGLQMVRFQRVIKIKSGKLKEALEWAKEFRDFVNKKESRTTFQIFREEFGAPMAIHWFVDFENLAVLEQEMATLMSDEEYMAFVWKSADFIIEGTTKDTLLRSF
jgi:hypothetical protein